ncbi:MAG: hypothetical protein NT074_00135 [Methanomicrobiales archaeon]|jgi:hypothetical protein|nr:hypothetical protein [Methanomicrobiales archaeon]
MKHVLSREANAAYERRAGFSGRGDFFVRKGLLMYEDENTKQHMPLPSSQELQVRESEREQNTGLTLKNKKVSSQAR